MPDRKAHPPFQDLLSDSLTITQDFFSVKLLSSQKMTHFDTSCHTFSSNHGFMNLEPYIEASAEKKNPCTVMEGTGCIFLSELGFQKRIKDLSVVLFLWLEYITNPREMCVYCLNRFLGNY